MLFCRLLACGIGTITVSLRCGIAGAYKRLWPQKGLVRTCLQNVEPHKTAMHCNEFI